MAFIWEIIIVQIMNAELMHPNSRHRLKTQKVLPDEKQNVA